MKKILSIVSFFLILSSTAVHASMIGNFLQISPEQLAIIQKDPSRISPLLYPEDPKIQTGAKDVDKAWQGIHFLLSGDPLKGEGTLALAVLGGPEIGDDVGYGPARFLTPSQVSAVNEALSKITQDEFRSRFNPAALQKADIYPPEVWETGEDAFEFLWENFEIMKDYYNDAAQKGNAMLIYIN